MTEAIESYQQKVAVLVWDKKLYHIHGKNSFPVKAKQTNSKFGNGTLRFFLTKSKNVKMVKLVKVRWDLRPPNVKDHIPPSAARCVVERCERLVYSVQKAAKPKRRQGGKKKKKPTTSSGHVKGEIPDQRLAASETIVWW